ncbi:uncharacterized protein LOC117152830 isoform X2 [Anabas testudineus]|uniref:uncharacterized protein LOC117152830 isoform X2 n=1 Tax=Anabas testudineus TaxID=64144 RepID=UPI00143CF535|nr:uncharacterized protein LOC117152830 isoform X2 [Anabas testudineus]
MDGWTLCFVLLLPLTVCSDSEAEDSGNFTCECSQLDGTFILHLNVTVEEEEESTISSGPTFSGSSEMTLIPLLIGVTLIMTMSGVILGFIHRQLSHGINRRRLHAQRSRPNMEPQDIEPYSTFIRRESGLYSTIKIHPSNNNANNSKLLMMKMI